MPSLGKRQSKEKQETLRNLTCVCFLAEENICESCLAPILPSGEIFRRGKEILKSVLIMSGIFIKLYNFQDNQV